MEQLKAEHAVNWLVAGADGELLEGARSRAAALKPLYDKAAIETGNGNLGGSSKLRAEAERSLLKVIEGLLVMAESHQEQIEHLSSELGELRREIEVAEGNLQLHLNAASEAEADSKKKKGGG